MSKASYAVGNHREARQQLREKKAKEAVSRYRGLPDGLVDDVVPDDGPEYIEVDEAALDRVQAARAAAPRSPCVTPEVSEAVSEEAPPTPPPRTSVSSGSFEPPHSRLTLQHQKCSRAPISLPTTGQDLAGDLECDLDDHNGEHGNSVFNVIVSTSPSIPRRPDLLPPHERTTASAAVGLSAAAIPEEDEDGVDDGQDEGDGDCLSNDLYSEVIEDEDLYVTVPSEWDGEQRDGSFCSSRSGVWSEHASPVAVVRPHRQPARIIVIHETSSSSALHDPQDVHVNGEALGPPDDLPDERPVPRLSVRFLPCCLASKKTFAGTPTKLSGSPGYRMLGLALLLFAFLVSLLLVNLAFLLRNPNSNETYTSSATIDELGSTTQGHLS